MIARLCACARSSGEQSRITTKTSLSLSLRCHRSVMLFFFTLSYSFFPPVSILFHVQHTPSLIESHLADNSCCGRGKNNQKVASSTWSLSRHHFLVVVRAVFRALRAASHLFFYYINIYIYILFLFLFNPRHLILYLILFLYFLSL